MEKIPTLFKLDPADVGLVCDEVTPGCEWVIEGEGEASRKWDGTCCMVRGGVLWKRQQVKRGKEPPEGFLATGARDPNTGKLFGWIPVGMGPEDQWHREAWAISAGTKPDGTYELCGPKVQGNPEHLDRHMLIPHGRWPLDFAPRDFAGIKAYLARRDIEGIVWLAPDGSRAKIRVKDFGIERGGG